MPDLITTEFLQAMMALTGVMITGIIGFVARRLEAQWGIQLDDSTRATLHSALNTGALMAWSRFNRSADGRIPQEMIDIVVDHVMGDGAKDAVERLNASGTTIRRMAEAKLTEVGAQLSAMVQPPSATQARSLSAADQAKAVSAHDLVR